MKPELKSAMLAGALLLTFAMFARAQITNEITFETAFPFTQGTLRCPRDRIELRQCRSRPGSYESKTAEELLRFAEVCS